MDLSTLEKWPDRNELGEVQQRRAKSYTQEGTTLGTTNIYWGLSSWEVAWRKGPGDPDGHKRMDTKLNIRQQHTLAAKKA